MSTINTILIKRRLASSTLNNVPTLSGGELAFSEKNHTLYYGGQFGTLTIGGSGAFVSLSGNQTVLGDKTFTGSTTLSSLTFSPDSVIDVGSNKIINLGAPTSDYDASTKKYVDDEIAALGSSGGSAVESLSGEIYTNFVKLIDDRAVDLSGGLSVTSGLSADTINTSGNVDIGGDLTITGDLQVLGAVTSLETTTSVTSAFSITNEGSQTAFIATQTGNQNVAEFYDDANIALAVVDGGNVGIGTLTPNKELTVVGSISATEDIFGHNANFTGTITGNFGSSQLIDFIIDGGTF